MSILPPQVKYPFAILYSDLITNSYGESGTRLVKNRESQSRTKSPKNLETNSKTLYYSILKLKYSPSI